ncbi:MAG: hypothetical protein J5928_03750 [Firmicutes bacterium]|nr:hypothetical protein [Bacillota bacterium]
MAQLDKKQLDIFAKALMSELYKVQARFDAWEKAIQDVVKASRQEPNDSPLESADIKGEDQDAKEQQST